MLDHRSIDPHLPPRTAGPSADKIRKTNPLKLTPKTLELQLEQLRPPNNSNTPETKKRHKLIQQQLEEALAKKEFEDKAAEEKKQYELAQKIEADAKAKKELEDKLAQEKKQNELAQKARADAKAKKEQDDKAAFQFEEDIRFWNYRAGVIVSCSSVLFTSLAHFVVALAPAVPIVKIFVSAVSLVFDSFRLISSLVQTDEHIALRLMMLVRNIIGIALGVFSIISNFLPVLAAFSMPTMIASIVLRGVSNFRELVTVLNSYFNGPWRDDRKALEQLKLNFHTKLALNPKLHALYKKSRTSKQTITFKEEEYILQEEFHDMLSIAARMTKHQNNIREHRRKLVRKLHDCTVATLAKIGGVLLLFCPPVAYAILVFFAAYSLFDATGLLQRTIRFFIGDPFAAQPHHASVQEIDEEVNKTKEMIADGRLQPTVAKRPVTSPVMQPARSSTALQLERLGTKEHEEFKVTASQQAELNAKAEAPQNISFIDSIVTGVANFFQKPAKNQQALRPESRYDTAPPFDSFS